MPLGRPSSLILLFSLGCGGTVPGVAIVVDPCHPLLVAPADDSTAIERESVARGVALWNAFGKTQLTLDPSAGAQDTVPVRFKAAAGAIFGFYDAAAGEVLINDALTDDHQRAITVAHELGHAMGLPHVPAEERPSLMNPANLVHPPTELDEQALMARWADCAPTDPE